MSSGRKEPGKELPYEEHSHACKRYHTKYHRDGPIRSAKTNVPTNVSTLLVVLDLWSSSSQQSDKVMMLRSHAPRSRPAGCTEAPFTSSVDVVHITALM